MNSLPKRVLQVIPSTGYGGISSMLMNIYRCVDRDTLQFDFAAFNQGPLHDEIADMGGRIFYFDYIKKQGIFSYMRAFKNLIQEHGPYQAVHVHNGYKGGFALMAARQAGIDIRVCHIHTSNVEQAWQRAIVPLLKTAAIINATDLLACGQEAGSFMYGRRPFDVLTNAINSSSYAFRTQSDRSRMRKELGIPTDCLVIGHVGRLSEVKNHFFMIDIADWLKRQHPELCFWFVFTGDGPLKYDLEQAIISKGLDQHFIFTGLRSDIPELLQAFDVYLFPSLFEGLPVSLLEAQASGLPCLVSAGVPNEADIGAGLVRFMDLAEGSANWAAALLEWSARGRGEPHESELRLIDKGYSIQENVRKLLHIYQL
ncbi:glycosyltransferase family 1 protein [Paenibacillus sp. ACRRX]|uniref:glycosyltransferase family 1 protein n=1 Tax=Paenibacillus sp. ACRRX TaxID=2918206 RepID=UPI001EF4FD04|nr:glycosyltransferase family 1 protein [Paenibacillus sp. ACRRX]MCG7406101.1 glycosyltransferase family 1 protein [Paenibacillus sp. ACRRX]